MSFPKLGEVECSCFYWQLLLLAKLAPGYKTSCPHSVLLEPANGTGAVCGLLV